MLILSDVLKNQYSLKYYNYRYFEEKYLAEKYCYGQVVVLLYSYKYSNYSVYLIMCI